MGVYSRALLLFSFICISASATIEKWDWSHIDLSSTTLPLLCGVATAEYQISGAELCPDSDWVQWEDTLVKKGILKKSHCSGNAANGLNNCFDDIKLLQELGCNTYRFSVEWSLIEPYQGELNETALERYSAFVDALLEVGIVPMITLHHFTCPQWFRDLGAFEKENNIQYFVRFCKQIFARLADRVHLWCTINEINATAFEGYIHGVHAPGHTLALFKWKNVVNNMLKAHCDVYTALKAMPNGQQAQIGPVHTHLTFEAYKGLTSVFAKAIGVGALGYTAYNADNTAASLACIGAAGYLTVEAVPDLIANTLVVPFMNYLFNGKILNFFKKHNQMYDFFGINCYSRVVLKDFAPTGRDSEPMTDMQFAACPEALYHAIADVSTFRDGGVPIYITENGIADKNDDRRALWIKRYLYAVSKAIKDGYDVRGYYYWSFMDNFEWNEGLLEKRFGLYEVDFNSPERTRTLRKGAEVYRDLLHNAPRA